MTACLICHINLYSRITTSHLYHFLPYSFCGEILYNLIQPYTILYTPITSLYISIHPYAHRQYTIELHIDLDEHILLHHTTQVRHTTYSKYRTTGLPDFRLQTIGLHDLGEAWRLHVYVPNRLTAFFSNRLGTCLPTTATTTTTATTAS